MKKILSFLLILFFFYPIVSLAEEEPSIIWNKEVSNGIVSAKSHHSMAATMEGGFVTIGTKVYPLPNGYPNQEIVLIKLDSEGNIEWEKHFGSFDVDKGLAVMVTPSNEYVLLCDRYLNGNYQSVLIKTNSSGNVIWEKTVGEISEDYTDFNITKDNGFILTGSGRGYATDGLSYTGVALKKLNENGGTIWQKVYPTKKVRIPVGTAYADSHGNSVEQTNDNGFIITGSGLLPNSSADWQDILVMKTDNYGNIVWQKTFNSVDLSSYSDYIESGNAIEETSEGGYILTGNNSNPSRIVIIKLTKNGLVEWMKGYDKNGSGSSVKITSDNGYIVTGTSRATVSSGNSDLYLFKVDSKGNRVWEKTMDFTPQDGGLSVVEQGGYYYISGLRQKDNKSSLFLLRYLNKNIQLNSVKTDLKTPQVKNTNIQVTAEATGGAEKLYKFWINDGSGWRVVQNYSTSKTFNWVPPSAGEYLISVYVKDKYSTSSVDTYKIIKFTIINEVPSPIIMKSIWTDFASPQVKNTNIQITADATGGIEKLYKFWINDGSGWKVLRDYSTSNTFNWIPQTAGDFQISVYVKDRYSTNSVDDYKKINYSIISEVPSPILLKNVWTDLVSPQAINTNIQVNVEAVGGSQKLYKFWTNDGSGWKVVQDYSTSSTFNWVPPSAGEYLISVYVKDKYSTRNVDDYKIIKYVIINNK